MWSFLKRWRRELEDAFRYDARVRAVLSGVAAWRAGPMPRGTDQERARAILRLCFAARMAMSDSVLAGLQERIRAEVAQVHEPNLDWTEFAPGIADPRMHQACILKPCLGPREKGVVFVSFETVWLKLLRHGDLRDFARRYTLVVSPSSSPHNIHNYLFAAAYPERFFTLISNPEDLIELPRVSERFIVVPLYASNWVNPNLYEPPPRQGRPFDLLMVANFAKFKRHFLLFKALQRMPRDIRLLLIGQHQDGRTESAILEEARWYGVADRFELRSNQPYAEVAKAFRQARASLILSRREGSCVVVAESMFADAPVAVLRGAQLGSRTFIRAETGRFVDEPCLARQLTEFTRNADRYTPRAWALANISCFASSQRLNAILREHALANGEDWTLDIAPLQWSPDPTPVHVEDRLRLTGERDAVRERYGLEIGRD